MTDTRDKMPGKEIPREPMPKSFKPVWIMVGLMVCVVLLTGVLAWVVDYFATH